MIKLITRHSWKAGTLLLFLALFLLDSLVVIPEREGNDLFICYFYTVARAAPVRHPYGDLYLLFVRESEEFIGFLRNS